ncbi:MAG: peroxidase [SAR202 cluster bacterium]|nr:peroxidase [SAR202 cluster bacterium]
MAGSVFSRLFTRIWQLVNRFIIWHRLPMPLAVINLVALRIQLREQNLHDTKGAVSATGPELPPGDPRLTSRTVDGAYNDLQHPKMGSAGARFARNVPLQFAYPEAPPALLTPSPREVSRQLLTRDQFVPATILNVLAAAWIQFQVHDWFNHGSPDDEHSWELPLKDDDAWPQRPMKVGRTPPDPTRTDADANLPPTFINHSVHWWDGSQIYGNTPEVQASLRSGDKGKLEIGPDGLLYLNPETGLDLTGFTDNYWVGLSLLHNLFSLEHNSICDRLAQEYPNWSDEEIYQKARLINAALMAKIHTVEWTPAILATPTMRYAMRGNWWGFMGENYYLKHGRLGRSEVISGIPGSPTSHHTAPYAMTEEFVAVYRLHPLIPDEFTFRSLSDDRTLLEHQFPQVEGVNARRVQEQVSMPDLFYSLGTVHPGAVTLHNYPKFLQNLNRPNLPPMDLAAVDVLRDRERGVPRYNQFRQLLNKPPVRTFEELTGNKEWADQLRQVYDNDINRVDTMVGMYAENPPTGFGFSDTAFRIFILMASRRLKSDRFFTTYYTTEVYTKAGMDWINGNTMSTVLLRHYPSLGPVLSRVQNAFAPWPRSK